MTVVKVWREVAGGDDIGNPSRVPASTFIPLHPMHLYPSQSSDLDVVGQATHVPYTGIFRRFPAGAYARIVFAMPGDTLEREWRVDGEPARHGGSPGTAHVTVRFVAASAEAIHVD